MENKIYTVKTAIENLDVEQFTNELIKSQNNEYAPMWVIYDFDEEEVLCMPIPTGTIIPNSMYLSKIPQDVYFEEFEEGEVGIYAENLIEDMKNMSEWIFYDENGNKTMI